MTFIDSPLSLSKLDPGGWLTTGTFWCRWHLWDLGGYTVKKVNDFPVPSRDDTNQLFMAGNKIIPGHEEPAGDGKIANLFYSVKSVARKFFSIFSLYNLYCKLSSEPRQEEEK